jgi:outer membrane protein TolC
LNLSRKLFLTICLVALGGCVAYHPKPLDLQARLPSEIPRLTVDPATLHLPHLAPHRFDPSDGLDNTEIAVLAVVNNPELRAARDAVGVARAQAFAAGLLPDPQLGASLDFPTNSLPGSTFTGYSFGLNYDLNALLTRDVAQSAALAGARKADLDLLWKEWQVASRSRLLFARTREQDLLMSVLQGYRKLLASRYDRVRQALNEGNATLGAADADLAALQDVERQINDLEREKNKNRHELDQLLGLSPQVQLRLVGGVDLSPVDEARVKALIPGLARRRPDLLALQAGYRSQDLRYRQAILEQFPALNVGLNREPSPVEPQPGEHRRRKGHPATALR